MPARTLAAAVVAVVALVLAPASPAAADVDLQPLAAQAARVADALESLGAPLPAADRGALRAAAGAADAAAGVAAVCRVLDARCLAVVTVNPESRVRAERGPAAADLVEAGWRPFLVKVVNEAGVTAPLTVTSPQALPLPNAAPADVRDRWLDLAPMVAQPLQRPLTGLGLEYRVVSLYSRDAGRREAKLRFDVGQGTQDLGFRGELDVLFTAAPSAALTFRVRDERGEPTTAGFVVRDAAGRVHPSQAKRLAPDFAFHPQVYRGDGESVRLPPGRYEVLASRGPEYLPERRTVDVPAAGREERFDLKRWVDPAAAGWYSGDHHIHAAGCAHYSNPTEGVLAADMIRQTVGEDLKVGCNLTWGPCFDFQKRFFTGSVDAVSKHPYLLRYDVEVSGFGSHQSGHLCLLGLRDQMYPGGDSYKHWPTLGLNTLRWAKRQGAVCGPAHSGNGLAVRSTDLPNFEVPPYDGIGANEYVVDVTHHVPGPDGMPVPAIDFISLVDTHSRSELNMWYHTLNCGYRVRGSGETDFPCIIGDRVGLGRSYVKLDGPLSFDAWLDGVRRGRCYASDGMSHLMDFRVGDVEVGAGEGELRLPAAGSVRVSARVAALLPERPDEAIRGRPLGDRPTWNLERARVGATREVPMEVVVNGRAVASQNVVADGTARDISFDVKVDRSSWVALRVLPSSHTNPVFVLVGGKPIRADRRSAEWCLKGVDACWGQKRRFIAPAEMKDAEAAYDHARAAYRQIAAESD